ncbi:MAG: LPS export ABC transporter periplasmic protein LptC [Acidobacteria bacterium]|nr:LPS export ABC transporter periplasmic protein LptC [Acidobacteriota bacterium]
MRLLASAIALTLMVIAGSYWLGRDDSGKRAQPVFPVAKNVQQQASGYTFTRSDEGRQVFTIHASRTVAFKEGGATVLQGVQVEVFGKDGTRRDLLRTGQCDYNSQSGDLFSSGSVEIELNAPPTGMQLSPATRSVMLETSHLYFRQQGSIVESEQPVRFRSGSISGSALGMRYWTRESRLELKSNVRVDFQPEGASAQPISLIATRARYEKDKGEIGLSGPVEVIQGTHRAAAASATLFLDARNRLTRAIFEGPVRASEQSASAPISATAGRLTAEFNPEAASLRRAVAEGNVEVESKRNSSVNRMEAQRVEIAFAGVPARPQEGNASGGVRITQEALTVLSEALSSSAKSGKVPFSQRELSTAEMRFSFQASGKCLRDADTVGPGKLVMVPLDPRLGPRTVTAGRMRMNFDLLNRLETMRGEGGTRIRFEPGRNAPAGSLAQEATADLLVARLDPPTESVRMLDQTGNFQFQEGERHATADQASYVTATESLTLTGKPQVWDAEMRARAGKIMLDLASGRAEGLSRVESTHTGDAGTEEPTSVLADRVIVERRGQTVRYEGHVRAWRGTDVVESAALEILRAERRVSSGSQVLTSHMQAAADVKKPSETSNQAQVGPATIRADHLEYLDQGRKAIYRGHVRLQTENTILEADRLDAYFKASGNSSELERAIADGNVKITQPGRRATGGHAEYFSADGKIVLSGGPPALYDEEKGFTSGQSLTFYSHDDRLVVSGGDKSTTISRHRIGQ